MKKIASLLFAGIIAMAFASVADAGTTVTIKAPKVQNAVTTNTIYNTIDSTSAVTKARLTGNKWQTGSYSNWDYSNGYYSTTKSQMNNLKTSMINSGWTFTGTEERYNSPYGVRYDYYERILGESSSFSSSHSVAYEMVDGVLTPVVNNDVAVTNTITKETKVVSGYGEPITLDTTNTGKITTAKNEWLAHPAFYSEFASKFDFTGDGIADNCEWLSDNPDALLCMPVKGQINGVTELFGNLGGYANGFDKLSVLCDKDGNGIVEGNELEGLMLWVDSNRNGIADAGELKTLESYGITKFYTENENFVGKYETSDGQTHTMWAWFPSLQQ